MLLIKMCLTMKIQFHRYLNYNSRNYCPLYRIVCDSCLDFALVLVQIGTNSETVFVNLHKVADVFFFSVIIFIPLRLDCNKYRTSGIF